MKLLLVAILLSLSASVHAGEAHVCDSPEVSALSTNQKKLNESTVFTCGDGVKGTIPELAKKGWKIVQVVEQIGTLSAADPSKTTAFLSMVIQKD